jgi:hypothetical protein
MAEIRGTDGVLQLLNGGAAVDCPPNARCVDPKLTGVFDLQPVETGHFWPRFVVVFAWLSVLLTLASMRLVVPAGLRFNPFRRRARAISGTEP